MNWNLRNSRSIVSSFFSTKTNVWKILIKFWKTRQSAEGSWKNLHQDSRTSSVGILFSLEKSTKSSRLSCLGSKRKKAFFPNRRSNYSKVTMKRLFNWKDHLGRSFHPFPTFCSRTKKPVNECWIIKNPHFFIAPLNECGLSSICLCLSLSLITKRSFSIVMWQEVFFLLGAIKVSAARKAWIIFSINSSRPQLRCSVFTRTFEFEIELELCRYHCDRRRDSRFPINRCKLCLWQFVPSYDIFFPFQ